MLTLFVQQNVNAQNPYPGYSLIAITEGNSFTTCFILNVNHTLIIDEWTGNIITSRVNSYSFNLTNAWMGYVNEGITFTPKGYCVDFVASASKTITIDSEKSITRHTIRGTINCFNNTAVYNVTSVTLPVFTPPTFPIPVF